MNILTPTKTDMTMKKTLLLIGDTSSFMVVFHCHVSFRGCTMFSPMWGRCPDGLKPCWHLPEKDLGNKQKGLFGEQKC